METKETDEPKEDGLIFSKSDLPELRTVAVDAQSKNKEGKRDLRVVDSELILFHAQIGHPKPKDLFQFIRENYPRVLVTEEQCKKSVELCMACISFPKTYQKFVIGNTSIPVCTLPNQCVMADNAKFFSKCKHGYTHTTCVIDVFTEFIQFYPSKGETAEELERIIKLWCQSYGNMLTLMMDRNKAFLSGKFNDYAVNSGIALKMSEKWLHSGIGLAECGVKICKNRIKKEFFSDSEFIDGVMECWCEKVRKVSSVTNVTKTLFTTDDGKRSLRASPAGLFFGGDRRFGKVPTVLREEYKPYTSDVSIDPTIIVEHRARQWRARQDRLSKQGAKTMNDTLQVGQLCVLQNDKAGYSSNQKHISMNAIFRVVGIDGASYHLAADNDQALPEGYTFTMHRSFIRQLNPESFAVLKNGEPGHELGIEVKKRFIKGAQLT